MNLNEINMKRLVRKLKGSALAVATASVVFFAETASLWAEEAANAEPAKLDPLAWKTDLALWTAVVFVVLLFVLCKFAFGPIVKALDQREKSELDRVEAAERANADAKALLDEYRRKLDDSEDEVRQIVAEAKKEATRQADAIVKEARDAAQEERERALKDVRSAADSALQEIAAKSADMATSLAGKILKEEIDPKKHSRLIENAVEEMTNK